MREREYRIVFQPAGRHVFAIAGTVLLEAAARAGLVLQTPCGGGGTCGKCAVRVTQGDCPPTPACRAALGPAALSEGLRLACQARVRDDLVVEVPAAALLDPGQRILGSDSRDGLHLDPVVRAQPVELPPPSQEDARADAERLRAALPGKGFNGVALSLLRDLPQRLRSAHFRGTAVLADNELVEFSQDMSLDCCGAAFDVGTTTLAGVLVDLSTGVDLASCTEVNPQTALGDDVVARIRRCRDDAAALPVLRRMLVEALNRMLARLTREAGVLSARVFDVVLAGNTTMQQLLCGIDSRMLGELPFTPAFNGPLVVSADDLGLCIHPAARAFVFPQVGGFVGGDTVAGIVATRLERLPDPSMLVDIGTNGEIVLAHADRLSATSVAAGPAFEGARISCGMRAVAGAVEKAVIDEDLRLNVIADSAPAGLCGSGLVDLVAELLRVGVIDETGRILPPEEWPADTPPALRRRWRASGEGGDFVLAFADEAAVGADLLFTQRDVRELQLATAAVRAGINILLKMHDLSPADLQAVLLAGGFGNFIRRNHARRIGLLPPVPCERIRFVGNTSAMGARMALFSRRERGYAAEVCGRVRHVDLSLSADFQMEFSAAMIFPGRGDAESTNPGM